MERKITKKKLKGIVVETLKKLGYDSPEAVSLLLRTAAVESDFRYVKQINGPARSYFQIEPKTAMDIYENYLVYRQELLEKVNEIAGKSDWYMNIDEELTENIPLSVAMARIHYLRVPEAIPDSLEEQAHYWKKYYNTAKGAGLPARFVSSAARHGLF